MSYEQEPLTSRLVARLVLAQNRRSYSAEAVLLEWGQGGFSAIVLARMCRQAQRDGIQSNMLNRLASCGSEGTYENAFRDLKSLLRGAGIPSKLTSLSGPYYKKCIRPTTVVKLLATRPELFRLRLAPSSHACRDFWRGLFSSEHGMQLRQLHPWLRGKTVQDLQYSFAISMHEDAGPFSKSKSMNVVSWRSMHARGTELETQCATPFLNRKTNLSNCCSSVDRCLETSRSTHMQLPYIKQCIL